MSLDKMRGEKRRAGGDAEAGASLTSLAVAAASGTKRKTEPAMDTARPKKQRRANERQQEQSEEEGKGPAAQAKVVPNDIKAGSTALERLQFDSKWHTPRELKELKQREGVVVREGRYTKNEDKILRNAVNDYLVANQVDMSSLQKFLFSKERQEQFREFWLQIGSVLPERPLDSIYSHLRRMFHPGNHVGPFTAEEDEQLKQYVLQEGRRWESISAKMGRFPGALRDRYRELIVADPAKGRWSSEEDELLRTAVKSMSATTEKDIPWTQVASLVPGRSHHQCRTHWQTVLNMKEKAGTKNPPWTPADNYYLVDRLLRLNYDDEQEIQWSFVPEGPIAARGTTRCRERWAFLKKHAEYTGTSIPEAAKAIRTFLSRDLVEDLSDGDD